MEAARLEEQIRLEFEKLHEFLRGEEDALLARVREETRRKDGLIQGKMKQLAEESRALLNEARQLQADLKEDDYTFLMVKPSRGAAPAPSGVSRSPCHPLPGCWGIVWVFASACVKLRFDAWCLFSFRPTRTASAGKSRSLLRPVLGDMG